MKHQFVTFLSLFLLSACLIFLVLWLALPLISSLPKVSFSPLPSYLSLLQNAQVSTLSLWQPTKTVLAATTQIDLTAKSAISYDMTTNHWLLVKNPNQRLPLASLTKIMTAVVSLEHPKADDAYIVRPYDLVGEDSMGLKQGEVLSLRELLYGLILHSGNDAAETLAGNFPGGRSAFILALNQKAEALGLENTRFTNPSGLQGDGDQYTTAYDLLILTKYALETFPTFAQIAATPDVVLQATKTHAEYDLENETNLLTTYPGVKGVKTGYTPEAGLCLVTYLDYGNHRVIAILLGSEDRRDEMKQILDYSLKSVGITPPAHG